MLKTFEYTDKVKLAFDLGCDERTLRGAVEELKRDGYMIVSSSQVKGYKIPSMDSDGEAEVIRTMNETKSRIAKLNNTVKCCRKWLNELYQEKLEV